MSPEIRPWRANMMTSYRFAKGSQLSGFTIGGGLRWQDKVAIGYPYELDRSDNLWKPIVSDPYYGPALFNGDAWVSYRFRWRDRFDCRIQLNARNVIGSQDAIPVRAQADGVVDVVRNPQPWEYLLTTTFSF